jgi:hypothetical protein
VAITAATTSALAGCADGGSELTTEDLLEKLAGHHLTTAEMAEQLELADLLCGFDDRVLVEIWIRLDARQLEFQDYVFGQRCPDRLSAYEETRPDTGTAPVTATAEAEAGPEPGDGSGDGSVTNLLDDIGHLDGEPGLPMSPSTTTSASPTTVGPATTAGPSRGQRTTGSTTSP